MGRKYSLALPLKSNWSMKKVWIPKEYFILLGWKNLNQQKPQSKTRVATLNQKKKIYSFPHVWKDPDTLSDYAWRSVLITMFKCIIWLHFQYRSYKILNQPTSHPSIQIPAGAHGYTEPRCTWFSMTQVTQKSKHRFCEPVTEEDVVLSLIFNQQNNMTWSAQSLSCVGPVLNLVLADNPCTLHNVLKLLM